MLKVQQGRTLAFLPFRPLQEITQDPGHLNVPP